MNERKALQFDWIEDASHENGNYQNKCVRCGVLFIGHKRRPFCKVCALSPDGAANAALQERGQE